MNATRLHNGAWQVSALSGGYLTTRTYYGYSRREAIYRYISELCPWARVAKAIDAIPQRVRQG